MTEVAEPAGLEGGRMPALYLSHGAPPLADDAPWTRELADWSAGLPPTQRHPDDLGALGGGAAHDRGHDAGSPGLRLLGLPATTTTR